MTPMHEWTLPSALREGRPARPGCPMVHLSYAQSIDGQIGTAGGDSRGLSSAESLLLTHQIRAESDAILVGIGTVLADDPLLNCRLPQACPDQAHRVIVDSLLRLPLQSRIVQSAGEYPTTVYCRKPEHDDRAILNQASLLEKAGISVVTLPSSDDGRIDLLSLLLDLGQKGRKLLFVEGGSAILTSFAHKKLVDLYTVFLTPRILGTGVVAFSGLGIARVADAAPLMPLWHHSSGQDLVWRLRSL